jgi:hypothetical protein
VVLKHRQPIAKTEVYATSCRILARECEIKEVVFNYRPFQDLPGDRLQAGMLYFLLTNHQA